MAQEIATNPRTEVKDAILANVSAGLDADAVSGVEWAAFDGVRAAIQDTRTFPNWDEYNAAAEVAL